MKYNTTIQNDGALPIPYAVTVGGKIARIDTLTRDKPQFLDVSYITGTVGGDLRLVCVGERSGYEMVINVTPDLNIKYVQDNDKVTTSNAESV